MGEDIGAFTVDSAGQVHARAAKRERTRSLIEFPYSDLQRAVELAQALGKEGGAGSLEISQLAASLNQSVLACASS